jgi:hypothetical protein
MKKMWLEKYHVYTLHNMKLSTESVVVINIRVMVSIIYERNEEAHQNLVSKPNLT